MGEDDQNQNILRNLCSYKIRFKKKSSKRSKNTGGGPFGKNPNISRFFFGWLPLITRLFIEQRLALPGSAKYFLSTFGKSNLTHLTTDVMFSGQHFAILAMFCTTVPIQYISEYNENEFILETIYFVAETIYFRMYVADLKRDFFDCVVTSRVLVMVNSDVDGGFL